MISMVGKVYTSKLAPYIYSLILFTDEIDNIPRSNTLYNKNLKKNLSKLSSTPNMVRHIFVRSASEFSE
jgi:hypothetical protein